MKLKERTGTKRYIRNNAVYELTKDEYGILHAALSVMFHKRSSVTDPNLRATQVIKRCCEGITEDGSMWENCPRKFEDRLKVFGFDYDTMSGIPLFGGASANRGIEKAGFIPKELKVDSETGNPIYSSSLISSIEKEEVDNKIKQMLEDFPDLNNATDIETVTILAKLLVIANRTMNYVIKGGRLPRNSNLDNAIITNIERLQKLLGINKEARDKTKDITDSGSIADLVREFDRYREKDFWEREVKWKIEELSLLLRKYDRDDGTGNREIDDVIFEILSDGISVEQAREIIKNPYYKSIDDLMDQIKVENETKQNKKFFARINGLGNPFAILPIKKYLLEKHD